MSFQFEERPDSRSSTDEPPSHTRIYKAVGEQDDAIVKAYAAALVPTAVSTTEGILYRQGIRIDPDGWAQFVVSQPTALEKKRREILRFLSIRPVARSPSRRARHTSRRIPATRGLPIRTKA